MDFPIVWTDNAAAALAQLLAATMRMHPARAKELGTAVAMRADFLGTAPFLGVPTMLDPSGEVREVSAAGCRLFYRVLDDPRRVCILTVAAP